MVKPVQHYENITDFLIVLGRDDKFPTWAKDGASRFNLLVFLYLYIQVRHFSSEVVALSIAVLTLWIDRD